MSANRIAANLARNKPMRSDRSEQEIRHCPWTGRWIKRRYMKDGTLARDSYIYCKGLTPDGNRKACPPRVAWAAGFEPLTVVEERA